MEYNNEENIITENPVILKEKNNNGSSFWYWIIGLLVAGVVVWFGFTSGWFGSPDASNPETIDGSVLPASVSTEPLAQIDVWQMQTSESFPVKKTLVLSGNLPDSCTYLGEVTQVRDNNTFTITLPIRVEEGLCSQGLIPFEETIELDILGLAMGVYTVIINDKEITFELEQDNTLDFSTTESK